MKRFGLRRRAFRFALLLCVAATTGERSSVEAYDLANNSWSERAPLPQALNGLAAVTVDGKLYVLGGYANNVGAVKSVSPYEPDANV